MKSYEEWAESFNSKFEKYIKLKKTCPYKFEKNELTFCSKLDLNECGLLKCPLINS